MSPSPGGRRFFGVASGSRRGIAGDFGGAGMNRPDRDPLDIDISVAHAARVYAYYLGDADTYFEADRVAAEKAAAVHPGGIDTVRASVRSNRAFLVRLVRWLATELGVRQFLDIGSGIPNGTNVHAVAQDAIAKSRVVYVDNDPVVLAHAHQLLRDTGTGAVAFLHDDLLDPASILEQAASTLDFDEPIAVLLIGVLHFLPDSDDDTDPYRIVSHLMDAVPTGSHLAVCHLARDIHPAEMAEVERVLNGTTAETWALRNRDQVRGFFAGLDPVDGVVQIDRWRANDDPPPVSPPAGRTNPLWVGLGRKR